jgi:tetratricopeptide (TPR) repeat protein
MVSTPTSSPDERVLRLIDAALELQEAGEFTRALEILRDAQSQAPDYAPIHVLMGLTYRQSGKLEEATASLQQATELDPDQPEAIQSLGLLLATQRRSREAVKWLKRHAELQPRDSVTLKALGAELARLGRQDEGEHILGQAWRETQDTEVGITYGRYLIRIGRWEQAEKVLRQVAETTPQPKPLVEWAYAQVLLERCEEALQVLQQILEIDPSFDRAWRGVSTCNTSLGQFAEALEAANRALAIDDKHCRNWLAKANALMSLGRHAEVLEAAQTGAKYVPPDDAEARPVLLELRLREVEALFQLESTDEALAYLEELKSQFPTEERFVHLHVSVLYHLERWEDVLHVLDGARDAGLPLYENLAPLRYEVLHILDRAEEAWGFIQPMVASQKEQLQALGDVGVSLYVKGKIRAARAVFEQLHTFAPEVGRFACNLGFILTGEGEPPEAEARFLRALEAPDSQEIRPLVLVNLGHLYLIQSEYGKAKTLLEQAASLAGDEGAILRIAYWQEDRVVSDELAYPPRSLPVQTAANANLVTLALAQGQTKEAETVAKQMISDSPDSPWGYEMLGWVRRTEGKYAEARVAWESAFQGVTRSQEQEVIEGWLQSLPT